MKVILALATLLAAVTAQTGSELVWCEDTQHYLNKEGVVLDTFDGIVDSIETCRELCDTDENGCNFVWFHPAGKEMETECKLIRDTYKWKPRSFRDRGYTYNGRLCMESDHKVPCTEDADCYRALHVCNMELRHCEDRPTEEPTEATEEPTEATEEPTEATDEPTEATEEPTEATEEPTEATEEPTEATEEPTEATEEPTEATEEPTEATEEPTEATEEPSEATEEPSEATVEPTEATEEPTEAVGDKWCAPSENYPNHMGRMMHFNEGGIASVDECMAACDTHEGCNFVWFEDKEWEGKDNRCRYFEGADRLKVKSKKDIRTHITYAGRLCTTPGQKPSCTKDKECYYLEHCNMASQTCEAGAPPEVDTSALLKVMASPVDKFGVIQLGFAALGVAAVLHGSYTALQKFFGRGAYTAVPAAHESEEV